MANVKTDAARVVRRKHLRARATRECFYTRLGGNLSLAAAAAAAGTSLGACVRLSSATTRQLSLCRSRCGRRDWCHDALSSSCTYSALERDSGWSAPGGGRGSGHPDRLTRSTKIRVLSLAVGLTSQHCALSFFLHFTSALQNCLLACLCLLTHLFSYALKESACCRICSSFVVVSTEIFINPGCFQCDLK